MELKITELLQTENKKVIVRAGWRGCGRCFQGVQHFNCGRWANSGNLMYNKVTSVNKTVLYIWNLLKIKVQFKCSHLIKKQREGNCEIMKMLVTLIVMIGS